MVISSKDELFTKSKSAKMVHIEALQDDVYIRKISGSDRLKFVDLLKAAGDEKEDPQSLEMAVSLGLSDEYGDRLFGDDELDQLSNLPLDALKEIALAMFQHNGLGEKAQDKAKKNSGKARNSGSSSPLSRKSEDSPSENSSIV